MLSGFGARTLNVAAHPSNFSTLNTLEHSHRFVFDSCGLLHVVVKSLKSGIVHGTQFPQQVYNITGLVLHIRQFGPPPNIGLSHESRHDSGQAFCCNIRITFRISAILFEHSLLQASLFIFIHPFIYTHYILCASIILVTKKHELNRV